MIKLDLSQIFKQNICTFAVAKQAAAAGMTPANTYFSYDDSGGLSDGAWTGPVLKKKFYPAINLLLALYMATEETTLTLDDPTLEFFADPAGDFFMFNYRGDQIKTNNLVDLFVLVWIKYKHDNADQIADNPRLPK